MRVDTEKKAKELTEELCKALNGGSRADAVKGVIEGLKYEHRYLQSEAIWCLLEALGTLATERTDGRNEHAIKACADLRAAVGDRIYWKDD